MKVVKLLESLTFGSKNPHAEPLHADRQGRAILFTLKPDQTIREHNAPSSPFFVVSAIEVYGVIENEEALNYWKHMEEKGTGWKVDSSQALMGMYVMI